MTESAPRIGVLLADDHGLVLDGLNALISSTPDLHVVGTARDGETALNEARRLQPAVLVIDLEMPEGGGLACLRALRSEASSVRVLMLSGYGDPHTLRAAIEGGADGFALKTDPPQTTIAAIRQVASGQLVFPQAARRWLARGSSERRTRGGVPDDRDALTEREESVLALVAEGKSNAEIADALLVSESTVKFHLRNLFAKLGVTNRTEATARFHRRR